jgi:hypothetical protein
MYEEAEANERLNSKGITGITRQSSLWLYDGDV